MDIKRVTLGIDVGGTNTVFGLVGREGKIYYQEVLPTKNGWNAEELFAAIREKVDSFLYDSEYELIGIGVGAPNANYYSGKIENPVNLDWGTVDVVSLFDKHYKGKIKAFITNDANAAAIGEKEFGVANNMKNFIEITLGTGLGGGIVVNGELVYGHDGFAGELGHVKIIDDGRLCGCGNRGCLETYASASGLVRTVHELLAYYNYDSPIREINDVDLNSKMVYEFAQEGDKISRIAFELTGYRLGEALANFAAALSPEAFILYGGLANAGELLIKPVKKSMEKHMMPPFKNKIKILLSGLPEDKVAIMGTAALAWHELEK